MTTPPASADVAAPAAAPRIELTILMPCLDEALTLPACIAKALRFLQTHGVTGEVLIADNGSTDGSRAALTRLHAEHANVRVVRLRRNFGQSRSRGRPAAASSCWRRRASG